MLFGLLHYTINTVMKPKKVTKHPCLKGLLWAIMYLKKDKHRSLRYSQRKALPRYKVHQCALIHKNISLSRAEWLSRTFYISDPEQPPKSTLGGSRQIHSAQLQCHERVSQSLPPVTTAPKERSMAVLTSERSPAAESLQTHQPFPSTPDPKHNKEEDSILNSRGQHVTG